MRQPLSHRTILNGVDLPSVPEFSTQFPPRIEPSILPAAMTKIGDIREPGPFGSGRKIGEAHSGSSFAESVGAFLVWAAVLVRLGIPALVIWAVAGGIFPAARGRVFPQLLACLALATLVGTGLYLKQALTYGVPVRARVSATQTAVAEVAAQAATAQAAKAAQQRALAESQYSMANEEQAEGFAYSPTHSGLSCLAGRLPW